MENELQKRIDISDLASDWCSKNAMVQHPAKTKSMLLDTRQKQQIRPLKLNLNLKTDHIEQGHEHRHLGIIIDDEFNWQSHITYVCKTVSKKTIPIISAQTLPGVSYFIVLTFLSSYLCLHCLGML